jgi:hypothetical protein
VSAAFTVRWRGRPVVHTSRVRCALVHWTNIQYCELKETTDEPREHLISPPSMRGLFVPSGGHLHVALVGCCTTHHSTGIALESPNNQLVAAGDDVAISEAVPCSYQRR